MHLHLDQFQSPIGTNKTVFKTAPWWLRSGVSIPYRYKQNNVQIPNRHLFCKSFNPLQVQTKHTTFRISEPMVICFNPLQVQTKHFCLNLTEPSNWCFNPLQVQTKLYFTKGGFYLFLRVSIPYRYKQNSTTTSVTSIGYTVSIPYRYKQNHVVRYPIHSILLEFQSPIGTNKTSKTHLTQKFH